jgi:hypothetical protein
MRGRSLRPRRRRIDNGLAAIAISATAITNRRKFVVAAFVIRTPSSMLEVKASLDRFQTHRSLPNL